MMTNVRIFVAALLFSRAGGFAPLCNSATTRCQIADDENKLFRKRPFCFGETAVFATLDKDSSGSVAADVASSTPEEEREIDSIILRQLLPALLAHRDEYGNPNIPLGTKEGRSCETLRRLQIQRKLSDNDVALLDQLGFRWHSLEDVYRTADFDELWERLQAYKEANNGDTSPPKKYPADPELGAWVTGIRRVGQEHMPQDHVDRLNRLGFEWVSKRQCGSGFMKIYRQIQESIANGDEDKGWLKEETNRRWVVSQQAAFAKDNLSATRVHYMEQILGPDWATLTFQNAVE